MTKTREARRNGPQGPYEKVGRNANRHGASLRREGLALEPYFDNRGIVGSLADLKARHRISPLGAIADTSHGRRKVLMAAVRIAVNSVPPVFLAVALKRP